MRLGPLLGLAFLAAAGCSSTPQPPVDAGPPDSGLPYDPTCSTPSTPGNSIGVGKFCCDGEPNCTSSGTACTSSAAGFKAIFCTTLSAGVTQWFCTLPCNCDSQCGEGAICASSGGESGCVPTVCAGTTAGSPCFADGGPEHPDAGP